MKGTRAGIAAAAASVYDRTECDRQRDILYAESHDCMQCGKVIEQVEDGTAVYFTQRRAWKLVHRKGCAFDAIFVDNPRMMKAAGRPVERTPAEIEEEKAKPFFMLYTPRESREKADELYRFSPVCSKCDRVIETIEDVVALHRNRGDKWLLVHQGRCAIDVVLEENALRRRSEMALVAS